MITIVTDTNIPYIRGVFEPFARVFYLPGMQIDSAVARNADVLVVRTRTRCDEALLSSSRVKIIATATIGTDHIDTIYCASRGIMVVSAAGCNARGVLQWVAAALVTLSCGGVQQSGMGRLAGLQSGAQESVAAWQPKDRTLGIVGVGHVGSLVRKFAAAWGFRVLCSDPPREAAEGLGRSDGFVPLEELAAEADIVTFHTPLTRSGGFSTWHLAGERFFGNLRHGAVVINSARGGVVDENLLKKAIADKGVIACIDTWEGEPAIDRQLLETAVIATPHIAGYTIQGKANASAMAVDAIARHFGFPLEGWYPSGVAREQYSGIIDWDEMCRTIGSYCDLETQSAMLKSAPASFESLRDSYDYRNEYF